MKLSQLTTVIWITNMRLDRGEQAPFTFDDIYKAADQGCLVQLLYKIDDNQLFALVTQDPETKKEVESALCNAAGTLEGRELRKAGIGDNPLCMVIAIATEAIQQNFSK